MKSSRGSYSSVSWLLLPQRAYIKFKINTSSLIHTQKNNLLEFWMYYNVSVDKCGRSTTFNTLNLPVHVVSFLYLTSLIVIRFSWHLSQPKLQNGTSFPTKRTRGIGTYFVPCYLLTKDHKNNKNSDSEATGFWYSTPISVLLCVKKYRRVRY